MNMAYVCFAVGLVYGFGLGVLLEQTSTVNATSFSFLLGTLILIPALGWIETRNHERRVANWEQIREKGKLIFILTRFVILRGAIIGTILVLFLRSKAPLSSIFEITVPLVALGFAFVGYQEWQNCELEYGILSLKSAAERIETRRRQVKEGID